MGLCCSGGRKDGFPGADGSTITQATGTYQNATTIPIYGANGNSLTEGSTGVQRVNIATEGIIGEDYTTIVYVIKNPLAFVYNTILPLDWYTNSETYQHNALWGNGAGKSTYDPCPKGWRVPTDGSWGDFSTITMPTIGTTTEANVSNGRIYCSLAWFPVEGYRYSNDGTLRYVGIRGYYWFSQSNGTTSYFSNINISGVNQRGNSVRSGGFAVRCVQE